MDFTARYVFLLRLGVAKYATQLAFCSIYCRNNAGPYPNQPQNATAKYKDEDVRKLLHTTNNCKHLQPHYFRGGNFVNTTTVNSHQNEKLNK